MQNFVTLWSTDYAKIEYSQAQNAVFLTWLPESKHIIEELFLQVQKEYLQAIIINETAYSLIDARELHFTASPDVQEKIANENFPLAFGAGLRRIAIVNSDDFVTQISNEQMMEEDRNEFFLTRFFNSKDEAIQWLLDNKMNK
jgi:hypothetical protein